MTTPSTGGRAIVRALIERNVDLAFGIPGTHNLEIYRHLTGSGIRHITPRHEQGGGYAADAYARVSGKPGVVVTTTGPGLTNAVTAAATSYADSLPVLYISPGVPTGMERADVGWLHEMKDQHAHLDAVVDRSVRVTSAAAAYAAIHDTFDRWEVERRRPVHIEVPLDVLDGACEDSSLVRAENHSECLVPDSGSLAAAAGALVAARSIMMVVGGGARQAAREVREVAERLGAPVVTTVNGKGVLPEDHALSLGASIRLGEAHTLLTEADALLIVGSVLGDDELWGNVVMASGTVVRLEVDAAQLDKNLTATHHLHGDAAATLRLLLEALPDDVPNVLRDRGPEMRATLDAAALVTGAPFAPFHEALSKVLPPTTIIAGDSAQVSYFGTASQWNSLKPGQFVYPAGFATLGYAIPGAIGAALASPETPVVAIAGDGGTMFTIQEFATAVDLRLPLPVVVFNNSGFQEIREGMEARGIDPIGVDVRSPDFPLLGKALGGEGRRVHTPAELADAVTDALRASVPTLIEVPI
jgi:thiamine pyrophosphate-dependent acetolactate synthase large subunit-like protein